MQWIFGWRRIPVIWRILAVAFVKESIAELAVVTTVVTAVEATVLAVARLTIARLAVAGLAIADVSTVVAVERSPLNGRSRLAVRDSDDPDRTIVLAISGSRAGHSRHEGRSYPV